MSEIQLPPVTVHRVLDQAAAAQIIPWWLTEFGMGGDDLPQGEGVIVGVVDTGADTLHVASGALSGAVLASVDLTGSPVGPRDLHGHGTHVAAIVAGRNTIRGMAPKCKLCIAKALGDDGFGQSPWVAQGIRWCVDKGCHIINCSLGSNAKDAGIEDALAYALSKGRLVVCASGNDGRDGVSSPADSDKGISVGCIDRQRGLAPFSNRGKEVDCVWPGVKVLSAYKNGGFAELSGTSMSCPAISGLLACLLSMEKRDGFPPTDSLDEIFALFERACDDLGTQGRDTSFGYGLPVPSRFFERPKPPVGPPPVVVPPGGSAIVLDGTAARIQTINGQVCVVIPAK
jgi:subtilisin family serine protease